MVYAFHTLLDLSFFFFKQTTVFALQAFINTRDIFNLDNLNKIRKLARLHSDKISKGVKITIIVIF